MNQLFTEHKGDTTSDLKPAMNEGGSTQVETEAHNVPSAALLDPKDSVQRPVEQSSVPKEGELDWQY